MLLENKRKVVKCYSSEGDYFTLDFCEAVQDAVDNSDNEVVNIWEADAIFPCPSEFVPSTETILEHMGEAAWDIVGEWAEDFATNVSKEAEDELKSLLVQWSRKHLTVDFFTVRNVNERKYNVVLEEFIDKDATT